MSYILSVDIGTSSVKAVAFSLELTVLASAERGYPLLTPKPGFCEQDPDAILNAVLSAIREVTARLGAPLCVTLSSAMHSLIALDAADSRLTNSIIWADSRSAAEARELRASPLGAEIYRRTGTPLHPMSPLPKLVWLRRNAPVVFNAQRFVSIKEYVLLRLLGEYAVDYGIASATGLFNSRELRWEPLSLSTSGISESLLSPALPPTTVLTGLRAEFAAATGLNASTKFVLGGADGCLANLGVNAVADGDAAVTIGTSGAFRVTRSEPLDDAQMRVFSYVLDAGQYVVGGAVNNGAVALQWLCGAMFKNKPPEAVVELATQSIPGSNGLIFLPYLLGERAPHWDADARGAFIGLSAAHSDADIARAVLEGVIFGLRDVGDSVTDAVGAVRRIFATGGFTRSELWVQILADVFGAEVAVAGTSDASCRGAAIVALRALGLAEPPAAEPERVFAPNRAAHAALIRNFEVYKSLYAALQPAFAKLTKIRED